MDGKNELQALPNVLQRASESLTSFYAGYVASNGATRRLPGREGARQDPGSGLARWDLPASGRHR